MWPDTEDLTARPTLPPDIDPVMFELAWNMPPELGGSLDATSFKTVLWRRN